MMSCGTASAVEKIQCAARWERRLAEKSANVIKAVNSLQGGLRMRAGSPVTRRGRRGIVGERVIAAVAADASCKLG